MKLKITFLVFVIRAYFPSGNWIQTDGNFGALFAVTRK